MSKIRINGETFDWDPSHKPMSEAIAVETALGMRYADWEAELNGGSAKAMAGFVWLVWRRNGRETDMKDILSGDVPVDYRDLMLSLIENAREAEADPTDGAPAPDPSPSTGTATSASSPSA